MKDHLEREQKFKDRMSIYIKYILIWYKLMKLISEMRDFSILAMYWLHFYLFLFMYSVDLLPMVFLFLIYFLFFNRFIFICVIAMFFC